MDDIRPTSPEMDKADAYLDSEDAGWTETGTTRDGASVQTKPWSDPEAYAQGGHPRLKLADTLEKLDHGRRDETLEKTLGLQAHNVRAEAGGLFHHYADTNVAEIVSALRESVIMRAALATALATVCRCAPPHPGPFQDYKHKDSCPVWQYGFTAAREILGIADTDTRFIDVKEL